MDAIVSYLYEPPNEFPHIKAFPRPSKEGRSHATAPSSEKDLVPASSPSFRSQFSIPSDMGEHIGTRVRLSLSKGKFKITAACVARLALQDQRWASLSGRALLFSRSPPPFCHATTSGGAMPR